jgi:APA family basic amino acid/polyamine antiporter
VLLGAVAAAIVPWGDVAAVASLASFAALLAFAAVNACVVALRLRRPKQARPFRVPLAVGRVPVVPVLGLASAGLLLLHFDAWSYVAGGAAILLALLLHGARVLRGRKG